MPTHVAIVGVDNTTGRDGEVMVTDIGQLIVAPFSYDEVVFKELAAADTAYNFYGPKQSKKFIITGIVLKADKQVSASTDADIVVYEANAPDTTTVSRVLFQVAAVSGDQVVLLPLNIAVSRNVWVNAKTSDDDIHMTITGYYVPDTNGS